ncbi:MAG: hypothetical protein MI923_06210 [Phycisphaerales bacterium]|nr:hypothetical protein [Phycisphaerales bacterium]
MRHHSHKGLLLLRQEDGKVVFHVLRTAAFVIYGIATFILVRFLNGSYQHELIGPEAKTLLIALDVVVACLLFIWKAPRGDIYIRLKPVHCCKNCGYDLKGNVRGICPECGTKNPAHLSRTFRFPFCRVPELQIDPKKKTN